MASSSHSPSRRRWLKASLAGAGVLGGAGFFLRHRLRERLSSWTRLASFSAPPNPAPHDPARDRVTLHVGRGGGPAANVDSALGKLGGLATIVGERDIVVVKVSAQWWNQGMTNVLGTKRVVEHVLERPGFKGEVIVLENTHFRLASGSGLSRAFTYPSERNVDVPGMRCLGDLERWFAERRAPVSFVGLVDAGPSALAGDAWRDPGHEHGTYGGDERGPLAAGDDRDGYHWDLDGGFRLRRSWVDDACSPLTWPRFTSPLTGAVVDFRDGIHRREQGRLVPTGQPLRYLCLTTANEHTSTGYTGCCKAAMGLVDMSAGRLGTDPRVRDLQSVHFFGEPDAPWRMAGPLAHFAAKVRAPDLYITLAEWVGLTPSGPFDDALDIRLEAASAIRTDTVVAGTDPVAMDAWVVRNLLMPQGGRKRALYDLDEPASLASCFLAYYRETLGRGTLDPNLIAVT